MPSSGHRVHPHASATSVEAWGPDVPTCLEELAIGVATVFADVRDHAATASVPLTLERGSLESQALQLSREIAELAATLGVVPTTAELVEDEDGSLSGFFDVVAISPARLVEQIPHAVRLPDGLGSRRPDRFGPRGGQTVHCEVIVSA